MLFSECFDIVVLAASDPLDLKNHQMVKRINSSHNMLAWSPVIIDADPFLAVKDDTLYLFYEEYHYRGRGFIKMTSTRDLVMWTEPIVVLSEDFHLSYPWVFQHAGQWYMMPETSAVHEVRLYKAVSDEFDRFEFVETLLVHGADEVIPSTDFCDSSIVERDGVYYLFTTVNKGNGNELHLYYSDSLGGEYERHPQSPLVVDDRGGRNGGALLDYNGDLYRFAQDCVGEYGKDIHVMKVNNLSKTHYDETAIQENILTINGLLAGHQYNFVIFKGQYVVAVDQKRRFPFLTCKVKRLFKRLMR